MLLHSRISAVSFLLFLPALIPCLLGRSTGPPSVQSRIRHDAGLKTAPDPKAAGQAAPLANLKEPVMDMHFMRSGGFAGMATQVAGEVVFQNSGAVVTSEPSGYRRELTSSEAQKLRSWADSASAHPVKIQPTELRDAYQYDVTVTCNGKTIQLTTHGEQDNPELNELMNWIRHECESIWQYRIQQR